MTLEFELTIEDQRLGKELVMELVGTAARDTEVELSEGVRLRFEGGQAPRGSETLPILFFVLTVPANVLSAVAAELLLERIRDRPVKTMSLRDGSPIDPNGPEAPQQVAAGIDRERAARQE